MDPVVIRGVIERGQDLTGCEKAREVNECMKGELGRE